MFKCEEQHFSPFTSFRSKMTDIYSQKDKCYNSMCIVNKCLYLYSGGYYYISKICWFMPCFCASVKIKPKDTRCSDSFIWKKKYNSLFTKTFSTSTLTSNTKDTQKKVKNKRIHEKTLKMKHDMSFSITHTHKNNITFTHRQILKDHMMLPSSGMRWRGGWGSCLYLIKLHIHIHQFVPHSH